MLGTEEDVVLTQTQTEELFVIYSGGCLPRAGRVRRVPLAARKLETCALRFPAQRTKIRTTKITKINKYPRSAGFRSEDFVNPHAHK